MGRSRRDGADPGMVRIYIGAGRETGIRPADLVGAIASEAKIPSQAIGAIEIEERFSIVDVPASKATDIITALNRSRVKGRKVPVRLFHD